MNKIKEFLANWWGYFLLFLLAVLVTYSFYSAYISAFGGHFFPVSASTVAVAERADWGVMGDFFGGMLNPAFSFLGLVLLLLTFRQNQKALALSQNELKQSNNFLKNQAATLDKQRFEDTFFSMLDQLNNALDKIVIGEKCCDILYIVKMEVLNVCQDVNKGNYNELLDDKVAKNAMIDLKIPIIAEQEISRCFRIIYQILKFISNNQPESSIKGQFSSVANSVGVDKLQVTLSEKMYSNMVRSLLSNDVYFLLAINGLCSEGEQDGFYKYKCLIERYAMLEHVNLSEIKGMKTGSPDAVKMPDIVIKHYLPSAFGENKAYKKYIESNTE